MKAYQLLSKPERWMKEYGNGQDNDDFRGCVVSALRTSNGLGPSDAMTLAYKDDMVKLLNHLNPPNWEHGIHEFTLLVWNDNPLRKWEEVYAALKECDL